MILSNTSNDTSNNDTTIAIRVRVRVRLLVEYVCSQGYWLGCECNQENVLVYELVRGVVV